MTLAQALLGAISPNIRMISLRFVGDSWPIEAILEMESPTGTEEISDVADEMSLFFEDIKSEISRATVNESIATLSF